MTGGINIVEFKREGWRDAVGTLRRIADQLESGDLPACKVGTLVMLSESGAIDVFAFGPTADDLQALGLFRLGEQRLIEAIMDSDE
jgi:hypothetical protein